MNKTEKSIDLVSNIVIGLFVLVMLSLSIRYTMTNDYNALHCEYNHTTHELISCNNLK